MKVKTGTYVCELNTTKKWVVYGLLDPRTTELKYVGCTKNYKSRYSQHCSAPSGTPQKIKWHKELKELNLIPIIILLAEFDNERDAYECENSHIKSNLKLLNGGITNVYKVRIGKTKREIKAILINRKMNRPDHYVKDEEY